jgi:hypothetical protein
MQGNQRFPLRPLPFDVKNINELGIRNGIYSTQGLELYLNYSLKMISLLVAISV